MNKLLHHVAVLLHHRAHLPLHRDTGPATTGRRWGRGAAAARQSGGHGGWYGACDMGTVRCATLWYDIPRDGWAQEARGAQLQEPHGGHHDVLYSYRDMNLIQNIELWYTGTLSSGVSEAHDSTE